MSGPVTTSDLPPTPDRSEPGRDSVEVIAPRDAVVGTMPVRRSLPRRERRTVGPWCFLDQMGPVLVTEKQGMDVAPHPHIGLQTATWLLSGEAVHRDSLGSEQLLLPGELNLMTAGNGVAHSEERTDRTGGQLQGVQLWIAQPEQTRHGQPAFEHHADLPESEVGAARLTVLVGDAMGLISPARRDTEHMGVDIRMGVGQASLPLEPSWEHGLAVLDGGVTLDGRFVGVGELAYMGIGRDSCDLTAREETRCILIGGEPFPEPVLMWWNFVARTRAEIIEARNDWSAGDDRFGRVDSILRESRSGRRPGARRAAGPDRLQTIRPGPPSTVSTGRPASSHARMPPDKFTALTPRELRSRATVLDLPPDRQTMTAAT